MLYSLSFDVSKRLRLSPIKCCEFIVIGRARVLLEVNLTLKGQVETAAIQGFTQVRRGRTEFV